MQTYRPVAGLSVAEELLHRMISDNTHVTREVRDLVVGLRAQTKELRHDHMHVSTQVTGLNDRTWRLEEHMRNVQRQLELAAKEKQKQEGNLWQDLGSAAKTALSLREWAGLLLLMSMGFGGMVKYPALLEKLLGVLGVK